MIECGYTMHGPPAKDLRLSTIALHKQHRLDGTDHGLTNIPLASSRKWQTLWRECKISLLREMSFCFAEILLNSQYRSFLNFERQLADICHSLRIRVSSHSLMQGSPVFKAMLGPRFKEGNALATAKSAIEIPLLDDDTDAMTIVCSVLHLAYGKVPDTLELEKLLKVAALVDKYDCAMAFRPSAYRWLALPSWGLLVNSCPEKIVVAYHLQHEEIFESMCKDLVMHVRGKIDYAGTSSVDNCPDVLMNLFGKHQWPGSVGHWLMKLRCARSTTENDRQ